MSALVKLLGKAALRLRLTSNDSVTARPTASKLGIELSGGTVIKLSGEGAGSEITDGVVKAGQRVSIQLGLIKPMKYHALVDVNPELHLYGSVGHIRIGEPEEVVSLEIILKTEKQLTLDNLAWVARVYCID